MGMVFRAVGFVVDLGPGTAPKTLFGKTDGRRDGGIVTSPALMALPMSAGAFGHWCSACEALEVLGIRPRSVPDHRQSRLTSAERA